MQLEQHCDYRTAHPILHIKEKRKGKGATYTMSATALILQQGVLADSIPICNS
jgi:hypothetical protein